MRNFLLPNEPTCIAACTSADARFWRSESRFGDWTEIRSMQHPESALGDRELLSDRPGRSFDSFGSGRHAMARGESARDTESRRFARDVADYLNAKIGAHSFLRLVLIAEPTFLGLLRRELSGPARDAVVLDVSLNPSGLDTEKLQAYFHRK